MESGGGQGATRRPSTSEAENNAVDILRYVLDNARLEHSIETGDKYPNHDGFIEIFENGQPIGRITIQVKKLSDSNIDNPKKQFKISTLRYSDSISEPFVLIVVDTTNEIAYWREIPPSFVAQEGIEDQKTRVVHFSNETAIDGSNVDYINQWRQITDLNKRRIRDYNKFEELKRRANPAIGQERSEFDNIHRFLDSLNRKVDGSFNVIKQRMFPDLWNYGYADINYEDDSLEFGIYHINREENDVHIKDVEENDTDEIFRKLGARWQFGIDLWNPIQEAPEDWAYYVVSKYVDKVLNDRRLVHTVNQFLVQEYLFPFLDEYGHLLGLDIRDSYSVAELNFGANVYLRFWLDELTSGVPPEHDDVEIHPRRRNEIEESEKEKRDSIIRRRVESEEPPPPLYQTRIESHDIRIVREMVEYLNNLDIESIHRPFHKPEQLYTKPGEFVSPRWELYSEEEIHRNISHFYKNAYKSYVDVVESNFPKLNDPLTDFRENLRIVTYTMSGDDILRPHFRIFTMDSGPTDTMVYEAGDVEVSNIVESSIGDPVRFQDETYTIQSLAIGVQEGRRILNDRPVFDYVYDKLIEQFQELFEDVIPSNLRGMDE